MVRTITTTDLSPDQIHEIGLTEVARIHREIEAVKQKVRFKGTLAEFFAYLETAPRFRYGTREEMLADYRAAQARIDPLTDRLFDLKPTATSPLVINASIARPPLPVAANTSTS